MAGAEIDRATQARGDIRATAATSLASRRATIGALAVLAIGPRRAAAVPRSDAWLRLPAPPDVPLADQDGGRHRLRSLLSSDRPVALQFFFTGCGTVCPPQTAILREVQSMNADHPSLARALILSISVDPLGDDPGALKRYAARFGLTTGLDRGWLLLTGEPGRIGSVLSAFGVAGGGPADHPSMVWLGDPRRDRWTRVDGLAGPAQLQARWREVIS